MTFIVQTRNTRYLVEEREDGTYISGHATYCPNPTLATIRMNGLDAPMVVYPLEGDYAGQSFITSLVQGCEVRA